MRRPAAFLIALIAPAALGAQSRTSSVSPGTSSFRGSPPAGRIRAGALTSPPYSSLTTFWRSSSPTTIARDTGL